MTHDEYLALVATLTEHDRRYYEAAAPTISDGEYDRLAAQLRAVEAAHPAWVVAWSPTQRVGHTPLSGVAKVGQTVSTCAWLFVMSGTASMGSRVKAKMPQTAKTKVPSATMVLFFMEKLRVL